VKISIQSDLWLPFLAPEKLPIYTRPLCEFAVCGRVGHGDSVGGLAGRAAWALTLCDRAGLDAWRGNHAGTV